MIPAAAAAQHLKEASSRAEKNREKKKKKKLRRIPKNPARIVKILRAESRTSRRILNESPTPSRHGDIKRILEGLMVAKIILQDRCFQDRLQGSLNIPERPERILDTFPKHGNIKRILECLKATETILQDR